MVNSSRIIRVGGVDKPTLLSRLEAQAVQLNDYARMLFRDPDFTTSSTCSQVTVEFVTLAEIGLPTGGRYQDILTQAEVRGLEQCPLELAPHLRLQYQDQPEGPYLTVASRELRPGPETPNGFYLRRINGQLWLRGYEAGPDNLYAPDFSSFAFVRPSSKTVPTDPQATSPVGNA